MQKISETFLVVKFIHVLSLRGSMRKQDVFVVFIFMSRYSNSSSQSCSNFCTLETDGDSKRISCAYKITCTACLSSDSLPISSTYIANNNGDQTEPCRTPEYTQNIFDQLLFHLIHVKHSANQFSNIPSNSTGTSLFINFM